MLSLGHKIASKVAFKSIINFLPGVSEYKIQICCRVKNSDAIVTKKIKFGKFAPVTLDVPKSYYYKNGWKLTSNNTVLTLEKCNGIQNLCAEVKFLSCLFKLKEKGAKRAAVIRCIRNIIRSISHKEIWLISDRSDKADDNGEAFFRFLASKNEKTVEYFFCISNNTVDFKRLKQYGKVIPYGGWKHKFYWLLGARTISSQADEMVVSPIWNISLFKDMIQESKFIFLQHGITKDDHSDYMNKYTIPIHMFVTSTVPEYKSFFEYNYFYDEDTIKLTGFPRYDLLYSDSKKYITIMPTWRKNLLKVVHDKNGYRRVPKEDFLDSSYFKFYSSLLNHPQLTLEAQRLGYTICFAQHLNMHDTTCYFKQSADHVVFFDFNKSYRQIFAESDMIVTDYSSVQFDFAYLRKPQIYCQFDTDIFFSGTHTYTKGYFDYEQDGFGEVEISLEDTVNRIIEYMRSGCKLKDKYRQRVDNTFAFNDKNNCERVYKVIKEIMR